MSTTLWFFLFGCGLFIAGYPRASLVLMSLAAVAAMIEPGPSK